MGEAKQLTSALGGTWYGQFGTAPCPVCQPEGRADQNALTLRDGRGRLLAHCKKSACPFPDVLRAAKHPAQRFQRDAGRERPQPAQSGSRDFARIVWEEAVPIEGSPAATYLRNNRMVDLPETCSLRFNPATWHGPTKRRQPAMIARIDCADGPAVLRTYLRDDGSGKADLPRHQQKLMLGTAGGGHVALWTDEGPLVVAEGIETALSLPHLWDFGRITLWAALTTSNMRKLRLPGKPRHLLIAADGDAAGRNAAEVLATRARSLGWTAEIRTAPDGKDWNDVWIERAKANRPSGPDGNDDLQAKGEDNGV